MFKKISRRFREHCRFACRRFRRHQRIFRGDLFNPDLSDAWSSSLLALRKHGYCKLPGSLFSHEILTALKSNSLDARVHEMVEFYTSAFECILQDDKGTLAFNKYGKLSFNLDDSLWGNCEASFLKDLHLLLSGYYNQDYWVRNPPQLVLDSASHREQDYGQSFYHLDWGFHQISLIVLLNSTSTGSTCTRVIKGSHRFVHFLYEIPWLGGGDRYSFLTRMFAGFLESMLGTVDLVGEAGACFLVDAGNSFHRAVYGLDRAMIHFNFAIDESYLSSIDYASKLTRTYLSRKNLSEFISRSR